MSDPIDLSDADVVRSLLDQATALRTSDLDAARRMVLRARTLARGRDNVLAEAEAVYLLASMEHEADHTDDAFALAVEAVGLADGAEPSLVLASALHLVGVVHFEAGNYAIALDRCTRAVEVYRATGEVLDEGKFLAAIAASHQSMGDYDSALAVYEEALRIDETLGRHDLSALVLGNLARLRGRRGEHRVAISLGDEAIGLARRHAPHLVSGLLADQAEASSGLGDQTRAADCLAEARAGWADRAAVGEQIGPSEQVALMVSEGRIALRGGFCEEAIESFGAALKIATENDLRETRLELHDHLATAYKMTGRDSDALTQREAQFRLHREVSTDATDLRLRSMQVAHDDETARERTAWTRRRTTELSMRFAAAEPDVDAQHLEAFERLAALAEARGGNTTTHTDVVGDLSAEIAHAIGQAPEWCERLRLAARLHDVGKVAVTDAVLGKPGPLDIVEYHDMKQHTVLGRRMLSGVSTPLFQMAAECAWSHHEWFDGTGYPNGLTGADIPLSGRIVAIADVFDALAGRRRYKREWGLDESAAHIGTGAGTQFDPELVEAFYEVITARHPELATGS